MERDYRTIVRRIQAPLVGNVHVAPSAHRGLGLFAAKNFRSGERITAYDGTLVPDNVVRRWSVARTSHVRTLLHQCLHIDGLRGNPPPAGGAGLASYANDGRGPRPGQNNARFHNVLDAANGRLVPVCVLVASKPIARGSEIMVSYGGSYWRRRGL